jgi:hypothetical protein
VNITPAYGQFSLTNQISRILNSPFADIEELLVVVDGRRSSASRAPCIARGKASATHQIDVDRDAVAKYDRDRIRSSRQYRSETMEKSSRLGRLSASAL